MAITSPEIIRQNKNVPYNFIVNVIDGGFFGLGLGFASLTTVIALFVSNMTDSAVLIGLIPAIHVMGWQLPQIFTAHRVAQQKRYKPMVMFFTVHERLPFLGLAIVSWFIPNIGPKIALVLTFILLVWQGLGGGFTANAWQNMIAKIIPRERWGVFFGLQSSAANLFASVGVGIAGVVLQNSENNSGFTICFLLASGALILSYIALIITREEASPPVTSGVEHNRFWQDVRAILKRDRNFRWFVVARILTQLGTVGFSFYTVYVVRFYGVDEATAGILAGVSMVFQTLFNPIMGWLGDRWSHRGVMAVGMVAAAASAIIARWAPSVGWFYIAYALAGIAYVATWTIALAMSLEFGKDHEKPAYIGMANTFIAPTAFVIPILAGWLADEVGYGATFMVTAVGAILTFIVLSFILQDQRKITALPE
ncbi:MAG TPA: MFS transporter [Anaerolineales bacterium]|nr:MFS transporter [Anaerolineales bacterium]